jgi:hypothetical protein
MNLHTYSLKNKSQNLCILKVSKIQFLIFVSIALPTNSLCLCPQINTITDADPQPHIFATNSFLVILRTKLFLDFLYELYFLWIFSMTYIIFGFSLSPSLSSACVTNCPCLGDRRFRVPDRVVST